MWVTHRLCTMSTMSSGIDMFHVKFENYFVGIHTPRTPINVLRTRCPGGVVFVAAVLCQIYKVGTVYDTI